MDVGLRHAVRLTHNKKRFPRVCPVNGHAYAARECMAAVVLVYEVEKLRYGYAAVVAIGGAFDDVSQLLLDKLTMVVALAVYLPYRHGHE